MNSKSIAPCGLICDLCYGFQRGKNKCVGCIKEGNKPNYCRKCSIRTCPEKNGNPNLLCNKCSKYPCRRLKDLDKRYRTKYGESLISNFDTIKEIGIKEFLSKESKKWKCPQCGKLLCVHKKTCNYCGEKNIFFPENN